MNDEIEESTLSVNRLIALCGVSLMVWVVIIQIGMYVWEVL